VKGQNPFFFLLFLFPSLKIEHSTYFGMGGWNSFQKFEKIYIDF